MGRILQLNSTRSREYHLQSKYGIGVAEYESMFKSQDGKCAGCGWAPKPGQRRLHTEHNHRTGKVRGLVCWRCNSAIKKLRDNPQTAYNLAVFLSRGDGTTFKQVPVLGVSVDDPRGDV